MNYLIIILKIIIYKIIQHIEYFIRLKLKQCIKD